MMLRLQDYANQLIQLSPLISHLLAVRDFLTNTSSEFAKTPEAAPTKESSALDMNPEAAELFAGGLDNQNDKYGNNETGFADGLLATADAPVYDNARTDSFRQAFDQFAGDNEAVFEDPFAAIGKENQASI